MAKVKINTRPVASNYATANETIIEYSAPAGGGLISFRVGNDGRVHVSLYRHDPTVAIEVSKEQTETNATAKNGDRKVITLENGDDFTSNEALDIRLPDGRKIYVWSDGSIEGVRAGAASDTLDTVFIADETNWR